MSFHDGPGWEEPYQQVNPADDPLVLTNFTDTDYWIPIYNPAISLTFNASGHARIRQTNPRNNNFMVQAGVRPRFTLYPAPTGGEIIAEIKLESYVHPVDFQAGDNQGFGFVLMPDVFNWRACMIGGSNVSANGHVNFCTTNSPATVPINLIHTWQLFATPTIIQIRIHIRKDMAGNPISEALGQDTGAGSGVFEYNLDGAGWNWLVKGALAYPWGYQCARKGLDFWIGIISKTLNQNHEATLTEFKLSAGILAMQ